MPTNVATSTGAERAKEVPKRAERAKEVPKECTKKAVEGALDDKWVQWQEMRITYVKSPTRVQI